MIRSERKANKTVQEKNKVFSTAFLSARNYAEQTNIPHALEIYTSLYKKMHFSQENEPILVNAPHFLELRYLSMEKVLSKAVKRNEIQQILELASGFTSHSINLVTSIPSLSNYIENDFRVNLEIKKEIITELTADNRIKFCAGNILEQRTWSKFESNLLNKPLAIFGEGLMMYLSKGEMTILLSFIKKILSKHGGFFVHEDMLKYHPELRQDQNFAKITSTLKNISKNKSISNSSFTQENLTNFYKSLGFEVARIPQRVKFSYKKYPKEAKEGAKQLKNANFKAWKLSLPKLSNF